MGYPAYPPSPRTKPPFRAADLVISIASLTLTVLFGIAAAFFGLFSLAFLDHCPPATCSADGAATAVTTALLAAVVVGIAGLTVTIVQLIRRRPAWPFAVATLVLCMIAFLLGGIGYAVAVG
jgi:hypothetical protein